MNQPLRITLKLLFTATQLPGRDRLYAYLMFYSYDGHIDLIARVPYLLKADNEATTFMNNRTALHKVKTIAMEIGATITNLSDFEPVCPSCRSRMLTEDVAGDLCCHNCGEEGPISQYFVGGIDSNYLEKHQSRI